MRERLGHERGDQPALLGERLDHVPEEDRPVTRRQRVGVLEVLLELAVGVLVIVGVVVPAQAGDRLGDLGHEVQVARERAHVVTRLLERVERVGQLQRAVGRAAQQEVLQLRADLQLIALLGRPRQRVAQDRARAVRPFLALDGHVAGEPGHGRAPGQDRQRGRVRHRRSCRGRRDPDRCRRRRTRRIPAPSVSRSSRWWAGTSLALGLPCMSTNWAKRNSIPLSLTILRTSSASLGASVIGEVYPPGAVLHNGRAGPLSGPAHVDPAHRRPFPAPWL